MGPLPKTAVGPLRRILGVLGHKNAAVVGQIVGDLEENLGGASNRWGGSLISASKKEKGISVRAPASPTSSDVWDS